MSDINYTSGNQVANAIDKRIIAIAKQVANKSSVNRTVYGRVTAKNNALFSVKINNTVYTNVVAFKDLGYINVGDTVVCLVPNNQFNNLLILGVADGTFASSSIYELNQASSTELGGVKANNRTVENQEVKIDPNTGFLYYSVGKSIDGIEKTSTSGLVDTYTITFTDGSFTTFTVTNADQINIRYTNGQLQWKYETEGSWTTLFTVDDALSTTSNNPIQNQVVTNSLNNIRNNINNNVVESINTSVTGDNFNLIQTLINLSTQATTQQSTNIPLANSTTAGLMSSSDFSSLQDLEDNVSTISSKLNDVIINILPIASVDSEGNKHGFRAGGESAISGSGGAIGYSSLAADGGAIGYNAQTGSGGAIGYNANSQTGGAVGYNSDTAAGGAVGVEAQSFLGGAIGSRAVASNGFSGGLNAKAQDSSGSAIDAIQLGTGTNSQPKTLQVYSDNIYNANTHTLDVQHILQGGDSLISQNQGTENAGKVLIVGQDGNVTLQNISSSGTTVTVNGEAQITWDADTKANLTQVVRTDASQTLTDTQKQQAQTNITHTATQNHATSGVQVGWYQVANLKTNGNYNIKIKQAYNYNFPEAIQLAISINHRLFTSEPFASITQISGVKPATFSLSKIRVRQGTDSDSTFLDVYNPDQLWNTTWVDITSDSRDVVVEPNSPFQFIGTEDNPSGYKVSTLDLITGFNTNSNLNVNNTVTISGSVSNLNTISQPVNSTVTYTFGGNCANAPTIDSGMVVQMQESYSYSTQLAIMNDSDASTWRRSYRNGTWTEWIKVGTFLQYEYNKALSFGNTGALYIGKFPIYDTNITVDISCTTSTTYSGKLVIACQNHVIMKASVFGDYSNIVTSSIYYKLVDNTVEIYFTPQAWSKNVIHITGCGIQGEVTHVCENISTIPSDATSKPENAYGTPTVVSNGYYTKHGDGTMEQHFTVTGSRGNVTPHTFLQPFKSGTTPIVHRTIDIDGSGNASQLRGWNISNLTNTGFSIYTTDISGSGTSMISAYGYWK